MPNFTRKDDHQTKFDADNRKESLGDDNKRILNEIEKEEEEEER